MTPSALQARELIQRLTSPLAQRKSLLAIDFGTTKLGLARAVGLTGRAEPLRLLPVVFNATTLTVDAKALSILKDEIGSGGYGGIIVGWPLDPVGALTPECDRTLGFLRQLAGAQVYTPVVLWDERHSTAAARAELREASPLTRRGTTAKKHVVAHEVRSRVDALAATNILNSFLAFAQRHLAGFPSG